MIHSTKGSNPAAHNKNGSPTSSSQNPQQQTPTTQPTSASQRCGNLQAEDRQIERFYFWRDRLVILKQAYDDATPNTLRQWWCGRRNGVQWYTFWVAILVLIITTFTSLTQCVEGALQVYKAYEPVAGGWWLVFSVFLFMYWE